ncbi:hypothetical protein CONLIGDRAFT_687738 [Coniochaeta ligniaria NRRL 30616]|uniref:Uncharacterized protein n=1 Tax=Coniochaeta ligniaria NRRL 30616 TaxID=1408157 RepID=A0A1J7IM81_9PEZI|nr:hypothetical protein CONLIGDRAFT_687738 [Coniochaeta ligniaria NRRL 30616]
MKPLSFNRLAKIPLRLASTMRLPFTTHRNRKGGDRVITPTLPSRNIKCSIDRDRQVRSLIDNNHEPRHPHSRPSSASSSGYTSLATSPVSTTVWRRFNTSFQSVFHRIRSWQASRALPRRRARDLRSLASTDSFSLRSDGVRLSVTSTTATAGVEEYDFFGDGRAYRTHLGIPYHETEYGKYGTGLPGKPSSGVTITGATGPPHVAAAHLPSTPCKQVDKCQPDDREPPPLPPLRPNSLRPKNAPSTIRPAQLTDAIEPASIAHQDTVQGTTPTPQSHKTQSHLSSLSCSPGPAVRHPLYPSAHHSAGTCMAQGEAESPHEQNIQQQSQFHPGRPLPALTQDTSPSGTASGYTRAMNFRPITHNRGVETKLQHMEWQIRTISPALDRVTAAIERQGRSLERIADVIQDTLVLMDRVLDKVSDLEVRMTEAEMSALRQMDSNPVAVVILFAVVGLPLIFLPRNWAVVWFGFVAGVLLLSGLDDIMDLLDF